MSLLVPQRSTPLPKLSWKGTFIDTPGNDANSELSPRALSDPGSVSSSYSSHFVEEQAYISTLAARTARYFSDVGNIRKGTDFKKSSKAISKDQQLMLSDCSTSSGSGSVTYVSENSVQQLQLHRAELTSHLRSTSQTSNQLSCNALASIYEIPEQVNEVLQLAASGLVDDVSNEISKACLLLDGKDGANTCTRVADQVQEIPELVVASFEDSFAKAASHVRTHVEDVMHTLERTRMRNDEVVEHLRCIPAEVQQITCQAVKEASLASQDRVARLIDHVLPSVYEEEQLLALSRAKQNIVDSLPQTLPEAVRQSEEVAKYNVESVSTLVAEKGMDHTHIKNRVVADTLLRAKVGDVLQGESMSNPGSRGHPEFCSRICIYFAKGQCTNGSSCAFCHVSHDKRPSHVDKRHRAMLKTMDIIELFDLMLPVLKSKFEDADKDQCDPLLQDAFAKFSQTCGTRNLGNKMNKAFRILQTSLKSMSARALIAMLCRSPSPAYSPNQNAIDDFVYSMKQYLSRDDDDMYLREGSNLSGVSRDGDWWRLV